MKKDPNIKRVQKEIHDVLINIWDPIGVKDVESAQDEYDSYIGKIHSLLLRGAGPKRLNRHLWFIENFQMGLRGKSSGRDAAIEALLRIKFNENEESRPSLKVTEIKYEKLILGKWVDDPEDFESIKKFGRTSMEFKDNGELIYTSHTNDGRNLVSLCVYRIEGNILITDQPSMPNEVRSLIEFKSENNLMLKTDGFCSFMIRSL